MKIGIVGSGMVGSAAANAMLLRGVGREIVLVDLNTQRAQAEADDILHAAPFSYSIDVRAGDYPDLAGSRVVVITAGVAQQPDETRLHLLSRNASVFQQIIPQVLTHAPDAVLLIATNPVDIMTHLAARYAAEFGVPSHRVVGSGTTLDTARYRAILGRHMNVDSRHVHGYVVGEHGDSEVLTWSRTTVGGMPLEQFCVMRQVVLDQAVRQEIDQQVRYAGRDIIAGKGATFYGIGAALAHIVSAVIHDRRTILTVCTPAEDVAGVKDVTVSLPHLVGGRGIEATFPLPLSDVEEGKLSASARTVREAIDSLDQAAEPA